MPSPMPMLSRRCAALVAATVTVAIGGLALAPGAHAEVVPSSSQYVCENGPWQVGTDVAGTKCWENSLGNVGQVSFARDRSVYTCGKVDRVGTDAPFSISGTDCKKVSPSTDEPQD
ncbi:hypothetical protein DQ384_21785 [Sphaerisporangium album]|uniref:Secreted protein n=1 Tax=Sphaerisporangium album TaxID=509200 RepID=A0A367FGF2_9ACTN|nr:hypothetical protein [Sphaerisporangium album]RCG28989.1 hypothetical protein DQ384_21785 [Sphaerisporangium album]